MSKRGYHEVCTYCRRTLEIVTSRSRVAATRDHVVPRAKGGGQTVWACRQCNALKKDMMPEDWTAFMESFPEWWKHPEFAKFGRGDKGVPYIHQPSKVLSLADTMMILKIGKKAWRAQRGEA